MLVAKQIPVIPEQYLQVLYQYSLSTSKTYGPLARSVISDYGLVESRLLDALKSSKQDERIVAANWIAELELHDGVSHLNKALKKEKRETAKAAMLSALHRLGNDISEYLSPKALLKEAQTGLKKAPPKGLDWFPFDAIPALKWKSGVKVDLQISKWWIVLACKLKQPEGNPLLSLYISTLSEPSQKLLGIYIINIFIERDTLCPSNDVAHQYAEANKQGTLSSWQQWAKSEWGESYRDKTIEDVYQYLYRIKKSEYLTSAIGEKGILALASHATPAEAVQTISRYMKDHYIRRHQIEALLCAVANSDDPIVIQLLLSIARRHRTNSVQERARNLVNKIADRNGWSQDELGDRTIPTAGLEINGKATLALGSRELTAYLSADLKIVLENEVGKTLKALPSARQDDDPEQVREAKKQFSASKKELKQVIDLQTKRLSEAMCTERKWPYEEWQEYIFQHPIMRHLIQKLVWSVEDGDQSYLIRPTLEMELIDIDDDEHEPSKNAYISIAHSTYCDAETIKSWKKHFKEEKLKPLFSQFNKSSHVLNEDELKSKALTYRQGWLTDAFTIRGVLTKLGYQRSDAEDGGFFSTYYKDFVGQEIRVQIEFSGNTLPEENIVAAITRLCFLPLNRRGWIKESDYFDIQSVPRILLNECILDYEAVAEKGIYDESWEKKIPW
jgi:hypothetical protein